MEKQNVNAKQDVNSKQYYTIDLMHILKILWQKAWIIILAALLAAGIGFGVSAFVMKPTYSSTILLYVNNSSISLGSTSLSISSSDITASQNLVKTYGEILDNRTTFERIIDKAEINYTTEELHDMIKSGSSNDTEIMYVTVTCNDPYEAAKIANVIAEVLPGRIAEIIENTSMEVVDSAVPNLEKVSPSITKYTAIGLILGVLASVAVISVVAMMDDRIHDEDYIIDTYDYPILAKIPNLVVTDSDAKYSKYKYSRYSKYYYYSDAYKQANSETKSQASDTTASQK